MGYPNRRYRVKDNKLEKRWDGTSEPDWFLTKADAWATVKPAPAQAPAPPGPAPAQPDETPPPAAAPARRGPGRPKGRGA